MDDVRSLFICKRGHLVDHAYQMDPALCPQCNPKSEEERANDAANAARLHNWVRASLGE